MKYAFINRYRRVWPISVQCRVLEASVAGHHEPFVRAVSAAQRRHLRTYEELLARGVRVGKERVQKWLLWCIQTRLHSTLACVSPVRFEQEWLAAQAMQVNS